MIVAKTNHPYCNRELYAYHIEIQQMQNTIMGKFMRARIADFYKHNKPRLDTLHKAMRELQVKYFVLEDNGEPKHIKDDKGELKPIMLEGLTFEQFQESLKELMAKGVNIIF